jgi:2-dehydro-3-deoxyglucarate aldolase
MKFSLKDKLKKNVLTIGSWLTIGHPCVAEIMADSGFEWIVIDIEHSSISLETVQILVTIIQSKGCKALVRVSKNEEVVIKRVLDSGADGVVVPMIKNREDALAAVSYAKYPPDGCRGVGLYRAQNYGYGFEKYKAWQKNELVIIAQIEHIEAVKNIDDIIGVDGIDGAIIGPYDLSASMGKPGEFDEPDVQKAIETVLETCKQNGFPIGFHVVPPDTDSFKKKVKQGCTFMAYSLDFYFMGAKIKEGLKSLEDLIGEK